MRYAKPTGTLLTLVVSVVLGAQEAPAPSADCTFNAMKLASPRERYHELSQTTELVAPSRLTAQATAAAPGRRRPSQPPKASTPPAPRNFIDSELFGKMVKDGVQWTARSSDAEFLRRVTLDLTGEIPDAETIKTFLADPDANKRDKAIDRLLNSPAFTDRWTIWFGDHVQNVQFSQNAILYPEGRDAYHKYIRDSIGSGKAYDVMVRELITGNGRTFFDGPANFYARQIQNNGPRQDTYDNLAAFTGQKFLGLPLLCLSCHSGLGHLELVNSSLARRTRQEFWKDAAFFSRVSMRSVFNANSVEMNIDDSAAGEYFLDTTSGNKTPRVADPGQPNFVAPAFFLSGEEPQAGETRRQAFARMLTAHPQFARATVNYIWKEVFGIGIVEPADSFDLQRQDAATLPPGAALQPTHPELLNQLADSFRQNNYNLRELLRLIVSSNAYQLSSRYTPGKWNESWTPYYARHYPRRLMAEEVLDAIFRATNVGAVIPVSSGGTVTKAMQLPDPFEGASFRAFLNNFGRGNRDDDERSYDSSIVQALALMNDRVVTSRVNATTNNSLVKTLVTKPESPEAIAEALYLATLSRYPTAAEKAAAVAHLNSGALTRKTEDLQFALLNRIEFLFN
jgi:hypothetical protein